MLGLTTSAAEGRWCRTAKRDAILCRLTINDRASEVFRRRFADRRLINHSNDNRPPASFAQRVKHTDTVVGDALHLLLLNRSCLRLNRHRRLFRFLLGDLSSVKSIYPNGRQQLFRVHTRWYPIRVSLFTTAAAALVYCSLRCQTAVFVIAVVMHCALGYNNNNSNNNNYCNRTRGRRELSMVFFFFDELLLDTLAGYLFARGCII